MVETLDKLMEVIVYFATMVPILATYKYNLNKVCYFIFAFMFIATMVVLRRLQKEEEEI